MRSLASALLGAAFALLLALSAAPTAVAKTPTEVLEPYRAYKKALNEGRTADAAREAYAAWQAAEAALGDSQMAGGLAANFAGLNFKLSKESGGDPQQAWARAIALSSFHGDSAAEIEAQRWVQAADAAIVERRQLRNGSNEVLFVGLPKVNEAEERIEALGLGRSTFAGEVAALRVKFFYISGKNEQVLQYADDALRLLKDADPAYPTPYAHIVRHMRATSLVKSGRRVDGLLALQELNADTPQAYRKAQPSGLGLIPKQILDLQEVLETEGQLAEAVGRGYVPLGANDFSASGGFEPIVRVPPMMPSRAQRSGWVKVRFDVDAAGRAQNIEVLDRSEKIFEESAAESVENWAYAPGQPGEKRDGVETIITFRLADERGRIIPSKRPKPGSAPAP